MRILRHGTPKPKYPWMKQPWECTNCRSIVEFDESDAGEEGYKKNGAYLNYHNDQREGESLAAPCPVCESVQWWNKAPQLSLHGAQERGKRW